MISTVEPSGISWTTSPYESGVVLRFAFSVITVALRTLDAFGLGLFAGIGVGEGVYEYFDGVGDSRSRRGVGDELAVDDDEGFGDVTEPIRETTVTNSMNTTNAPPIKIGAV